MGKSLREALAEQMAALRARGIAPEALPEGEEPEPALPTNGYDAEERRPRQLGKRAVAKRRPPVRAPKAAGVTATAERPAPRAARPPSIGKVLERRAEVRRQEQTARDDLRQQLSMVRGSEVDDEGVDAFTKALEHETGALPPLPVVIEAIRDASSGDPEAVADAVRRYYRRPRRAAHA